MHRQLAAPAALRGSPALAVLGIAAAALFAAVAADVFAGTRLSALDLAIARFLHRHATPASTGALLVWTDLNSTLAMGVYAAVAALVLALRRRWSTAAFVIAALGGVLVLNVLLKLAFQRARPQFDDPLLTLATYSFPSGHVAASTVGYGLVVAWLFSRTADRRWRALAIATAALAIALVAFSRIALGVHYLSDAVAGCAEGVAWMAICLRAFAVVDGTAAAGPAR